MTVDKKNLAPALQFTVKQKKASIKLQAQHLYNMTSQPGGSAGPAQVWTYCSSESKDVVSGHLERWHGLVDILVQAVILNSVSGT